MKKLTRLSSFSLFFIGFSFCATAQINTAAGGATAVVANSPTTNTNVGIGTNVPKSKLDVKGALTVGATYGGLTAAPSSGAIIEGSVGIGTTVPKSKLDVKGSLTVGGNFGGVSAAPTNGAIIEGSVGFGTATPKSKLDIKGSASIGTTYAGISAAPANGLIIEGNVGVGTTTPTAKLDVNGQIKGVGGSFPKSILNGTVFANGNDQNKNANVLSAGSIVNPLDETKTFNFFDFQTTPTSPYNSIWFSLQNRNDDARFVFSAVQEGAANMRMLNKNQDDIFRVDEDGNDKINMILPKANSFLGIGTTSSTDGVDIFKLSVAGNIRANRVKVYTTWADFVFEKEYKLASLEEVEKHIQKNGHLKDIPSASEVEKSGIELGEMNKLLLQKVEELTLYVIQLNKELQDVKSQIKKD